MVYKKYIKKNGKFYGPYIYNSRRVNGKVISEYQGTGKKDYRKFVFFIFGILLLAISIFVIIDSRGKISGNVVANNQISFNPENVISNDTLIYPVVYFTLISSQSNQKEISNQTVGEIISNSDKTIINSTDVNPNINVTENNPPLSNETPTINQTNPSSTKTLTNENQTLPSTNTIASLDNSTSPQPSNNVTMETNSQSNSPEQSSITTSATSSEATSSGTAANPSSSQTTSSGTANTATTQSDNSAPLQSSTSVPSTETNSQSNSPEQSSITTSATSSEATSSGTAANPSSEPTSSGTATSSTTSETTTTPPSSTTASSSEGTSTPITGNIISGILRTVSNFFLSFLKPTGMAVSEQNTNREINGQVSADKPFTYSLNNGETIQLLSGSVKTDSTTLPDDTIKIVYQGNNIVISTNYSENVKSNTSELNVTSEPVNFNVEPLNDNEQEILNKEFGNFSVQTTKSELFNGRYIIRYQLGDYNIEYSYDSSLNNETLRSQIENDKTKWLRDIANKLSNTVSAAQNYSLPA